MKYRLLAFLFCTVVFTQTPCTAFAWWCWYEGPELINEWPDREIIGHYKLNNHRCVTKPEGNIVRSKTVGKRYSMTYSASASGEFDSGDVGFNASAELSEELEETSEDLAEMSLPESVPACTHWERDYYDSYYNKKYQKWLVCWKLLDPTENFKGQNAIVWSGVEINRYYTPLYATLTEFKGIVFDETVEFQTCKDPPCPTCEDSNTENRTNGDNVDEQRQTKPRRQLGALIPTPGENAKKEFLVTCGDDMEAGPEQILQACIAQAEVLSGVERAYALSRATLAKTYLEFRERTPESAQQRLMKLYGSVNAATRESPVLGAFARLDVLKEARLALVAGVPTKQIPDLRTSASYLAKVSEIPDDGVVAGASMLADVLIRSAKPMSMISELEKIVSLRPGLAQRLLRLWIDAHIADRRYQTVLRQLVAIQYKNVNDYIYIAQHAETGRYLEDAIDALYIAFDERKSQGNALGQVEVARQIANILYEQGEWDQANATLESARIAFTDCSSSGLSQEAIEWEQTNLEMTALNRSLQKLFEEQPEQPEGEVVP